MQYSAKEVICKQVDGKSYFVIRENGVPLIKGDTVKFETLFDYNIYGSKYSKIMEKVKDRDKVDLVCKVLSCKEYPWGTKPISIETKYNTTMLEYVATCIVEIV